MKLYTYLNYGGTCRQAFEFYEQHLGGKITMITTHGELPESSNIRPEWKDKVLHARMELGDSILMGADIPLDVFKPMRSAYLTLIIDTVEETERIYELLTKDGEIFMNMRETFFAERFGMFRDRFGTSWMLLKERSTP